jgi:phosphoglycolate phosphatase
MPGSQAGQARVRTSVQAGGGLAAARGLRYPLVIFDFDGTLVDSFPWFMSVLNDVARRWRFRSVQPGEETLLRGMSARQILAHLRVSAWKVPLVARDLRRRMSRDIDVIRPFAGVEAMLQQLHGAGACLAIATSNSADNVQKVLGAETLARIRAVESGSGIHGKAIRLRRLLNATGFRPEHALYVGDEVRDVQAARAAGISAAAVTWGYNNPESLRRLAPDLVFDSIDELLVVLADGRETTAGLVARAVVK